MSPVIFMWPLVSIETTAGATRSIMSAKDKGAPIGGLTGVTSPVRINWAPS